MSVKVHEAFSIDSFQDRLLWWDDFLGDQVKDEWRTFGASVTVVDAQTGGIVRLTTGAVLNNAALLDWQDIRSLLVTKKATMEVRAKAIDITYVAHTLRLTFDVANQIRFIASEAVGGATNWDIETTDGGATTLLDTGVILDTDYHIFRIECHTHGASHVHFYIDGVETGNSPITTNIPDDATDYLQPYLRLQTLETAAKSTDIDYVVVRQEI